MKATAVAPANIAFIKYWGKADGALRLPANSSISMNLSGAQTMTTVEFSASYAADRIEMVGETLSESETKRAVRHLGLLRHKTGRHLWARVATKNNFPKATGIASSASGFAALTVAACAALGFSCNEKELTILARLGSGSACRSIPDGFVQWQRGGSSETSYAQSLYPSNYWALRDILLVVQTGRKPTSSTAGMAEADTSPLWRARLQGMEEKIAQVKRALKTKDLRLLGETAEAEALNLQAVMQTQFPPLVYWNDATRRITEAVKQWRASGLPVYFTVDAGPNVHLICENKDTESVQAKVKGIEGVRSIIVNRPSVGAHLVDEDLF